MGCNGGDTCGVGGKCILGASPKKNGLTPNPVSPLDVRECPPPAPALEVLLCSLGGWGSAGTNPSNAECRESCIELRGDVCDRIGEETDLRESDVGCDTMTLEVSCETTDAPNGLLGGIPAERNEVPREDAGWPAPRGENGLRFGSSLVDRPSGGRFHVSAEGRLTDVGSGLLVGCIGE